MQRIRKVIRRNQVRTHAGYANVVAAFVPYRRYPAAHFAAQPPEGNIAFEVRFYDPYRAAGALKRRHLSLGQLYLHLPLTAAVTAVSARSYSACALRR